MKQIDYPTARIGTKVFDTKTGKFGTLVGYGFLGTDTVAYVDFDNRKRIIKPWADVREKRYLYYRAGNKNPEVDKIITNLSEAIEFRDCYISDRQIRNFVKRNYDELKTWTFAQFVDFASDLEGSDCDWRETCRQYDLK